MLTHGRQTKHPFPAVMMMEGGAPPSPTKPHISALPPGQAPRLPAPQGPRSDIMAHHSSLLLCTCMLALLAPVLAFQIENLTRLKANQSEILNLRSDGHHDGEDEGNARRGRAIGTGWPKDCSEISAGSPSGVYVIQPSGLHPIVVYCEMNVTGGGWTVIQRNRYNTDITWAESWSTYKYGFGNVHSDYWLGTEYIHQIAKQKVYQVRFVIQDASNNIRFAEYNLFSVGNESQGYQLRLGSYSGTAGDAMTSANSAVVHDNMKFSAKDLDQDTNSGNCASTNGGGWWYSSCYSVRLNFKGYLTWSGLCNGNCRASAILIKPALFC
ncbi:fibrinogen-like protein 1-like protein isoform X9 [Gallus gallus]|uniref:fibrinogen-like protein 1-like protein isoform X9 n=1 Tax=Gallus gallus TaxID=9031 RepID=UPI001F031C58|nr:fibrinogen-like protein 1-like protein isoform X9 [Gallus gallus]